MKKYEIIKPLKGPMFQLKLFIIVSSLLYIVTLILFILRNKDADFLLVLSIWITIATLLPLWNLEWWKINEYEIIVRNIFIPIRKCSIEEIKTIKIRKLNYLRDFCVECYIINDHNNRVKMHGYAYNSGYKIPLKIPVTEISKKYLDKYMH
jgi:hypothetical protein